MTGAEANNAPGRWTEYELRIWGDGDSGDIVESGQIPASQLAERLRWCADFVWRGETP